MSFVIKGELLDRYSADGGAEKIVGVPAGIRRVSGRAFYECPAEEILLPEGIYYIGDGAFSNSKIRSIRLPASVTTIGEGLFLGCDRLEFAEIPGSIDELKRDTFWTCFRMKRCRIHEGVKKIQPSAFSQCRNAIELVNGEFRVTLPFVSEWDMSAASKCLELIGALGTGSADGLLEKIANDEHKLPLAVYCYAVHRSAAAKAILADRANDAAVLMINDGDNALMLEEVLTLGGTESFLKLLEAAERAGAKQCAALLEPYAAAEREEEARAKAAAEEAARLKAEEEARAKAAAEEAARLKAEEEARAKAAAEEAARLKAEEEARAKAAAEEAARAEAQSKAAAAVAKEAAEKRAQQPASDLTEGFDFTPQVEVFRSASVDSELIYRLKSGLTLHSEPKKGFECRFDEDGSSPILVIRVTDGDIMRESLRSLLHRCFFGEGLTLTAPPTKRIAEMDLKKEFSGEPQDVLKMLLTDTDILEASEILDEWSIPVPDAARARQAVPEGATHEHCIYRNGRLEYYELFSWNVRVAEFEGGTIKEICDGADCEWDTRSLERFIDSLPAVTGVQKIKVKRPERLRLPYTCHSVGTGALGMDALRRLVLCRRRMSIGSGVISEGMTVVGTRDSTAERLAESAGAEFEEGFGVMRGAGRVFPVPEWSIEAPEESVWQGESDYMSPMLEYVSCGGAAEGSTLGMTFVSEKLTDPEKGLAGRFGGKLYRQLYRDGTREIGIGVEPYAFRLGEIVGLTAATYYISGCVAIGDKLTTMLTSYVGSAEGAAAAIDTVCGLMATIRFTDTGATPSLIPLDPDKLSEELRDAEEKAAAAANAPERVTVSEDWAVTIPKGCVWSADPDVIRGHRCLLILGGGEGSDVAGYYNAAESYSFMASQGPICSGDLREYCNKLRIRKLGLMSFGSGSEKPFVLKHNSDIAVFVRHCEIKDGSRVFRAEIITRRGVYPMQAVFGGGEELSVCENKLLGLLMTVCDKDSERDESYMRGFFELDRELRRASPEKPGTAAHFLETKKSEDGFESWLRMGIQLRDSVEYALRAVEDISAETFGLSETAWKLAEVFAVDEEHFDPKLDREQEIRHCYIRETEYLAAFRSFAWLAAEYSDANDQSLSDIPAETVLALAQLVESRGALCWDETHYSSICGVPDTKVLYLPDGLGSDRVDRLVNEGGWTRASLDSLRRSLAELRPCIEVLHERLSADRDRTRTLRGIHSDILYVWCSLTIAADKAFALTTDAPVSCDFKRDEVKTFADFEPQVFIEPEVSAAPAEEQPAEEQESGIKSLICGERIPIEDLANKPLVIEPTFSTEREGVELDGYAFMLTREGKVLSEDHFIFFGQSNSPCGTIALDGENSCRFTLELSRANAKVANIVIVYAVYGDDPELNLSQVHDMNIGFFSGGERVMEFIPEPFSSAKAMAACEIYRHDGLWKIRAVGRGYKGSLEELCGEFGIDVE